MKIKITKPGYYVSNRARTATRHIKDYVYDTSEEDAQRLVKEGVAELVDEDTPTCKQTPQPTPKKKRAKKPKPAPTPESEELSDGEV